MTPTIKKLAVLLLVITSAYSSLAFLIESIQGWNPRLITNDGVYDWDARLSNLRADLPPDVDVVGYVSGWDVLPEYDFADNETEYVLTQYSLAPVIVTRSDQHSWVIVNLEAKDFKDWVAAQPTSIEVTEYPGGLYLVYRP